jgi:hypothetical protein
MIFKYYSFTDSYLCMKETEPIYVYIHEYIVVACPHSQVDNQSKGSPSLRPLEFLSCTCALHVAA